MVADAATAARLLGWRPRFGLTDMVSSTWRAARAAAGSE
jgi:UDP-glucose 4-epimerase